VLIVLLRVVLLVGALLVVALLDALLRFPREGILRQFFGAMLSVLGAVYAIYPSLCFSSLICQN
jgi:hypothetical protein